MKKWVGLIIILVMAVSLTGCSLFDKDKDESTSVSNPGNDPGQMQILDVTFTDNGSVVSMSGTAKNVGQGKCTDIVLYIEIKNLYGTCIWYEYRNYLECLGGQTLTYNGSANIGSAAVQAGYNVFYQITYYYYTNSGSLRKIGR